MTSFWIALAIVAVLHGVPASAPHVSKLDGRSPKRQAVCSLRRYRRLRCFNPMTEPKADILLTTILPRLPAEGQQWINGMEPFYRETAEHILNLVGADNFVKHWKTHREDEQNFEHHFG
jgi:hypothetical protein